MYLEGRKLYQTAARGTGVPCRGGLGGGESGAWERSREKVMLLHASRILVIAPVAAGVGYCG